MYSYYKSIKILKTEKLKYKKIKFPNFHFEKAKIWNFGRPNGKKKLSHFYIKKEKLKIWLISKIL